MRTTTAWRVLTAALALVVAGPVLAADAALDRAAELVAEGRYRAASELLGPQAPDHGNDARFHYLQGRAALGLGQAAGARIHFQRSLELEPGLVTARLGLARANFALGQTDEARREYEAALAADTVQGGDPASAGHYAAAYDIISPYAQASPDDDDFAYLLGRAALGAGRPEEARALFQRALDLNPESVPARLGLGRAYVALGRPAEARVAFESVLTIGNLAADLRTQVEIYDRLARQYLEEGRNFTTQGYGETGFGGDRVNSTRDTVGGEPDTFTFNARFGGGFDYLFGNDYSLDGNIDYRFRYHDDSAVRNDSDLRWRFAGTRALGDQSLTAGFRGRVSYRGDGNYRNDYSVFASYRRPTAEARRLTFGADLRRRSYPSDSPDRPLSRTTASGTVRWEHDLGTKVLLAATGFLGHSYETSRLDGDSDSYGLTLELDYSITSSLSTYAFFWWENESFDERVRDNGDGRLLRREDDLFEMGGQVIWAFAPNWTFRPEFLYTWDKSNIRGFNFSSTEYWINVRRSF